MKFIGEKPTHKTVLYFGIALFITSDIKWIAVDEDGKLFGYLKEPGRNIDMWGSSGKIFNLGKVDLEGMDWRETLKEV